ncbi:MAG: antitoxin MazE family protein [Actinomycetia bacterium]|nr:antitoxin MazE family protein [Actinomycetes bacterium]
MEDSKENLTGAQRVQRHRERLRAEGMRPVQLWVVDVRTPDFVRDASDQAAVVAASSYADDDQAFIDALSDEAL